MLSLSTLRLRTLSFLRFSILNLSTSTLSFLSLFLSQLSSPPSPPPPPTPSRSPRRPRPAPPSAAARCPPLRRGPRKFFWLFRRRCLCSLAPSHSLSPFFLSRSLSSLPFFSPPLSNARPDRMKGYNMEGTKKRGLSPAAKQKVRSFFRFFFFLSFCHFLFLQKSSRFLPLLLTFPPTISTTNYRNSPRPRRRSSPTTAEAASK